MQGDDYPPSAGVAIRMVRGESLFKPTVHMSSIAVLIRILLITSFMKKICPLNCVKQL